MKTLDDLSAYQARTRSAFLAELGGFPDRTPLRARVVGTLKRDGYRVEKVIFVSATPGPYEREKAKDHIVEQVIRPTGLVDPEVEVRPARGQVDDLLGEVRARTERSERVLVTTLTKRMAEDLTEHLTEIGVKARYLHADITTLERAELKRDQILSFGRDWRIARCQGSMTAVVEPSIG